VARPVQPVARGPVQAAPPVVPVVAVAAAMAVLVAPRVVNWAQTLVTPAVLVVTAVKVARVGPPSAGLPE
ncbi:hypothetical protein, partial [Mycobacterium marinum]|uniref:hypothetical protein n=1 Tax=Mycobacterium marinum TaxID=1781 RepID=UPI003567A383